MKSMGNRKGWHWRRSGAGWLGLAALALGMVWLLPLVRAQDEGQPPLQDAGQPARAIRLSYVDGNVTLSQGGQVIAAQAVMNTPLLQGMSLTTSDNGRAEIQFEDGSVARLAPDSKLTLQVLSGQGTSGDAELVLNHGLAYFELQGGTQIGPINVHFGDSVATASGFTVLRVDMDKAPGELAVFSGNAHLETGDGAVSLDLHGGESVALNAEDPSRYDLAESIPPDSWDAWNSDRDKAMATEAAAQTGAPDNLGGDDAVNNNPAWNDLDENGSWYDVPGEGDVWSPYAATGAGFDPYGNGNWTWIPSYGYIWASGYPWGYLPFQCGAWNFYSGFGWGWAPGFGGCEPWWGMGFYGGPNIGFGPPGYLPIQRPPLRPPMGRMPHRVIPVHRLPSVRTVGLPVRSRNAPVMIAGHSVRALRLSSRPEGSRVAPAFAGRTAPTYTRTIVPGGQLNGARSGYVASRPRYVPAPRSQGVQTYTAPSRSYTAPSRGYSAPSRGYSGGGGGGGGFHGGGGGGGAHGGGGGGRR